MTFNGTTIPLISIVTPNLNGGEHISQAILSVLKQDYPNIEYLIIDGGSTDDSLVVIRSFQKKYPGRIQLISQKRSGQTAAINEGFDRSKGILLNWLNSDDFLLPRAITTLLQAFSKSPASAAFPGWCHRIDSEGRILYTVSPEQVNQTDIAYWGVKELFYQPACFFKRSAWEKVRPLDETLYFGMDLDLWLKLSRIGDFYVIHETLAAALLHEKAKTVSQRNEMIQETMAHLKQMGYTDAAEKYYRLGIEKQAYQTTLKGKSRMILRNLRRNFFPKKVIFPSDWE